MIFTFDVSPLANGHDRGQVATVRDYVISIEYSSELLRKFSKKGKSWYSEIRPIVRAFLFD